MTDPFKWLRLVRLALAVLVLVVSVAGGIPVGIDPGAGNPIAGFTRLVGGVVDIAENAASDYGDSGEVLGEIFDEPIGGVGEPGVAVPEFPTGSSAAGGVLGGGESLGPDGGVMTPVAPIPQAEPDDSATEVARTTPATTTSPGPTAQPSPSPTPAPTQTASVEPTPTASPSAIRLNEAVLRFLPEIEAASSATGVPAPTLAGVIRVESNGDPNLIANGSRYGLTGVAEAGLVGVGVAPKDWNDPAANVLAGAAVLVGLKASAGSWDFALEAYFGGVCDTSSTCPGDYRFAVQAWSTYYASAIVNPSGTGFAALPATWTPPPLAPYHGQSIRPMPLPPGVSTPTPTPQPTATPISTTAPTQTPGDAGASEPLPTDAPTEVLVFPTESPTLTIAPTPTPVPTETGPP